MTDLEKAVRAIVQMVEDKFNTELINLPQLVEEILKKYI